MNRRRLTTMMCPLQWHRMRRHAGQPLVPLAYWHANPYTVTLLRPQSRLRRSVRGSICCVAARETAFTLQVFIMSVIRKITSIVLAVLLSVTPALTPLAQAQSADITPPKVLHEPDTSPVPSDQPYVISATVSDESGVGTVTLFFRQVGSSVFNSVSMKASGNNDLYITEINPDELSPPGLEYYIQAEDAAGNTLLRGFTFEPLILTVTEGTGASSYARETTTKSERESGLSSNKWLWIGLGVLAVGGLAAAGGGGGGGSSDPTVTIEAPVPQ